MDQRLPDTRIVSLILTILGTGIAIFASEIIVRVLYPDPTGFYIQVPNKHRVFEADPQVLPGVQGPSHWITNSRGVRGDELERSFTYRIVTLGGSTTECLYLDQSKAWPQQVQELLNDRQDSHKVWVGNCGKTAVCTREHRLQVPRLLEEFQNLDTLLLLVGANDVLIRLARERFYDPHHIEKPENFQTYLQRSFAIVPKATGEGSTKRFRFKTKELIQNVFGRGLARSFGSPKDIHIEDEAGRVYIQRREFRKKAKTIRDELPDLESGLEEYERNLGVCCDEAKRHSVRVILMTQPVLWDPDLPQDLLDLLWTGGVFSISGEGLDYYSVEVLSEAMDAYNERLREIAEKRGLDFIDLASMLPKDSTIFYDDCHFNENGSRLLAKIVVDYLLERPPF